MPAHTLPIDAVLPELKAALRAGTGAVLVAEPGAGKTTRVPLALLDEPWLAGQRILMLEPRRLAARAAAQYLAAQLGEAVGQTVGYRVKLDTRVSGATRIEVMTEGVLTRLLQDDPALEGAGIVIFDEFHERSLQADLGLALCRESQELLREELRILVMSATLEAEPVAALLGSAPVIRSEGRTFPVVTHYRPRPRQAPLEVSVAAAVVEALAETAGDLLVFLPGAAEIRRTGQRLAELSHAESALNGVRIHPLHGSLSPQAQDRALRPSPPGERKVVLATNVAETSLTVEGVQAVIDGGLMRVARFSPRTGMTRLETVAVSRASADQRRGRAGRLGPGVCYRLWSEHEQRGLAVQTPPEIADADLAPVALELAARGVRDPADLAWLDPPPAGAYNQAVALLIELGALTGSGAINDHGRQILALGVHPRLAHMILRAAPLGLVELACETAAVLSNRDVLAGSGPPSADLRLRLQALHAPGVDPALRRHVLAEARALRQRLGLAHSKPVRSDSARSHPAAFDACGLLLAFAYPDRIAGRRPNGNYLLYNGRGAFFRTGEPLAAEPYLVAAELDDQGANSRIDAAAPIDRTELEAHFAAEIVSEARIVWDASAQAVRARQAERLGALTLGERPLPDPDPEQVLRALLDGIAQEGLGILPWNRAARQVQQRLLFLRRLEPEWPDGSDEALAQTLSDWLAPHLYGLTSRSDLQKLNLTGFLLQTLTWAQQQRLDAWAPTHLVAPSGSRIPIDYADPAAPSAAVRLQELFGLQETPRLAGGRVPLTLQLLSPAQRPVQVTQDLANFWRETYFEVRKELKGRYPKHHWPDDPLSATPTARAKRRS